MAADRVVATAPVRVADVGGWTDTWFGSPGRVCYLAVGPGVTVEATGTDLGPLGPNAAALPVRLVATSLGSAYRVGPAVDAGWSAPLPGTHPILEHAIGAVLEGIELPPGLGIDVTITSAVPPGASLGTSASVLVALVGALDALAAGGRRSPAEVAALAHQAETVRAGREAGVQDQWAAALGGCGLLVVGPYPEVHHEEVPLSTPTVTDLLERLVTVVFGPHDSSAVHTEVIDAMLGCGGAAHDRARGALRRLSALAGDAADALWVGEVDQWAQVLVESTEAQQALHPGLIGPAHTAAIEVARSLGAVGWKVNGAGGTGGSLTLVTGSGPRAASAMELEAALAAIDPLWRILDLTPDAGLTVSSD